MGPELETTGTEHRLCCSTPGRDLESSARAFPKSLIYNISLMTGQTRGYEFESRAGRFRGRNMLALPDNAIKKGSVSGANEKVSLV